MNEILDEAQIQAYLKHLDFIVERETKSIALHMDEIETMQARRDAAKREKELVQSALDTLYAVLEGMDVQDEGEVP